MQVTDTDQSDTGHSDDSEPTSEPTTATADGENLGRHRLVQIALRIIVALFGLVLGVAIGGHVTSNVGPLTVQIDLAYTGGANTLTVPPLGAITVHPYVGPVGLDVTLLDIDAPVAKKMLNAAAPLPTVERDIASGFENAVILLFAKTLLISLLFVALFSALLWRRPRKILLPIGITLAIVVGSLGVSAATFDVKKTREPQFEGTIAQGPGVVGDVKEIELKYTSYRKALVKLVTNVSRIYSIVTDLPAGPVTTDTIRVLHISDIHLNPDGLDLTAALVKQFKVSFIIDTGDLNDWGTKFEDFIVKRIKTVGVEYVYVKGNHDSVTTVDEVRKQPNAIVLDDKIVTVQGLTIAGIGDPRFTPDKADGDDHASLAKVESVGKKLAKKIDEEHADVDMAVFHDPKSGKPLYGDVPLILAGHTHVRKISVVGGGKTLLMVAGSTGAAGLRGTEPAKVKSLETTILYISKTTKRVIAWDEVTQGGLGQTDIAIKRHENPIVG